MSDWRLLYSNAAGDMREHPTVEPLGGAFGGTEALGGLIPLPEGATLCMLPGCTPIGRATSGEHVTLKTGRDYAVGALLPTGYARLYLPAYQKEAQAPYLPLFGYTAVAARHGRVYAAALSIDDAATWQPADFNTPELPKRVTSLRDADPDNRLYAQLALCAEHYGCYTAQNIFYRRWEGAIPSSPRCAARCVGCISEQEGPVPSPQIRLDFSPTPDDIAAVAVRHLTEGGTMVSFGQGCEGDPLNRARSLSAAIRLIRAHTNRGIINMNTNGWNPRGLEEMCQAGLNRIRVSLFSAHPTGYDGYYRPRGYGLAQVEEAMRVARRYDLTVAINLLVFPGYSDCEGETEALIDLMLRTEANEIQLRTLNIDREMLADTVPAPLGAAHGIAAFVSTLRERLPHVQLATHANPDASHVYA